LEVGRIDRYKERLPHSIFFAGRRAADVWICSVRLAAGRTLAIGILIRRKLLSRSAGHFLGKIPAAPRFLKTQTFAEAALRSARVTVIMMAEDVHVRRPSRRTRRATDPTDGKFAVANRFIGGQTARSLLHFNIGRDTMAPETDSRGGIHEKGRSAGES